MSSARACAQCGALVGGFHSFELGWKCDGCRGGRPERTLQDDVVVAVVLALIKADQFDAATVAARAINATFDEHAGRQGA